MVPGRITRAISTSSASPQLSAAQSPAKVLPVTTCGRSWASAASTWSAQALCASTGEKRRSVRSLRTDLLLGVKHHFGPPKGSREGRFPRGKRAAFSSLEHIDDLLVALLVLVAVITGTGVLAVLQVNQVRKWLRLREVAVKAAYSANADISRTTHRNPNKVQASVAVFRAENEELVLVRVMTAKLMVSNCSLLTAALRRDGAPFWSIQEQQKRVFSARKTESFVRQPKQIWLSFSPFVQVCVTPKTYYSPQCPLSCECMPSLTCLSM